MDGFGAVDVVKVLSRSVDQPCDVCGRTGRSDDYVGKPACDFPGRLAVGFTREGRTASIYPQGIDNRDHRCRQPTTRTGPQRQPVLRL
jgi:hypothetical protein